MFVHCLPVPVLFFFFLPPTHEHYFQESPSGSFLKFGTNVLVYSRMDRNNVDHENSTVLKMRENILSLIGDKTDHFDANMTHLVRQLNC